MDVTHRRKLTLATCCTAHAVQDGLGAALNVLMPILAQVFGLSYAQVGIVRAASSTSMSVFELLSGFVSERLGERSLLVFGLACAGAGYALLAAANGLAMLAACLFIVGIGSGFQHALSSAMISDTFEGKQRRSALGVYNSAGDVGKLTFTGLFSLALGAGLAWTGLAVAYGLIAIVCGVAAFVALERAMVGGSKIDKAKDKEAGAHIGWGIKDRNGFGGLSVVVLLDTAVQTSFLIFVAFLAVNRGIATEVAGFATVLTLTGGIFGKAGCGYLAAQLGPRNAFFLVQGATAALIVLLVFLPLLAAALLLPVLGIFLQGSSSITYGAVNDMMHEDRRSRGFALIYSFSGLAAIAGPIAFGYLGDSFGLDIAVLSMAAVSLLAVVPGLMLRPPDAALEQGNS